MDKILAIVGPTGIGKSACSIELAKALDAQIISGDSMQVYRQMNIGTAKITPSEMQGIKHYLVGIQDYRDPYNVCIFQKKSKEAIDQIQKQGKLPIFCGGTGLYLKAALYDYTFEEEQKDEEYLRLLETKTNEELFQLLQNADPQAAEKIHPHNRKRLIRALEIAHGGITKTQREKEQEHKPLYDVYFLGLTMDRQKLHQRIDQRVDKMFEEGLVQEVTSLFADPKTWEYTSFQGIGYKEFKPYFEQKATLEEVKLAIQKHSRQYAKRQMTWFKHQMPVHWFEKDDPKLWESVREWYYG
ncbi:tRNA (adenosine(37)-N6)-dimethylallyltransferase MiaA [Faecalicoccus acidiformans]|uniref:tRNA dimethylallyltransferase n=1 Tax=Faecalicoccus acidiformans TaxID=915173 RepID=A0ABS2FQR1_9FIRM|nr:tRNA (adenosine(37)-N6)-dimethylallyltransferase MiaA [Faecalicoccus acidiformans]